MNLDTRTIIFLNFICSLMISVGLLTVSRAYLSQRKDVKHWAYATFLQTIGWMLVGLRGQIPDFISILGGNVAILLNIAIYYNIICSFKKIKINKYVVFIPIIICIFILYYYTYIDYQFYIRAIAVSLCSASVMFTCCYMLVIKSKNDRITIFTMIIIIFCGILMLTRAIYFLFNNKIIEDNLLTNTQINELLTLTYFVIPIFLTTGFMLMINDKYFNERKKVEAEHIYVKEILEETNQIAMIGNWEINKKNKTSYHSEIIRSILEIPKNYIADSQSILKFYKESKNKENLSTIFKNAQKSPIVFDENVEIITHKGNERWIRILGKSEFTNNKCDRIFGVIQDITEKKLIEKKLIESEKKFRNIVETANEGIWILDKDWKITFINEELCNILEYSSTEIIGKYSYEFMTEEGKAVCINALQKSTQGLKQKYATNMRTKSGKEIWASFSANPIFDEENIYCGLLAMVTDVTESIITNLELKKSESKYRSLFNNNPNAIYIWDIKTYKIVEVNDVCIDEYGYTKEEFYKMTILDLRPIEDQENFLRFVESLNGKTNRRITKTWKHINKNRELIDMEISSFEIVYNNRPSILSLATNISEKILVQNLLKKSYHEIRMLSNHLQSVREEERTHIAREIHDELGQQLTALKLDIISLDTKPTISEASLKEKTNKMIAMVDLSAQSVKKIITQLRPSILDDLGLIAALEWQSTEFQKRTKIICEFKTSIDNDEFNDKIKTSVFRIFQESLTNIERHSKATKVYINMYVKNDLIYLEIQDNGIGILNEKKQITFGLLGMKERATMLNGDISIKNASNGGTIVNLKIPISC